MVKQPCYRTVAKSRQAEMAEDCLLQVEPAGMCEVQDVRPKRVTTREEGPSMVQTSRGRAQEGRRNSSDVVGQQRARRSEGEADG